MVMTAEEKAARSAERKARYAEERRMGEVHAAATKRAYAKEQKRQRFLDRCYETGEPAFSVTLHYAEIVLLLEAVDAGLSMLDNGIPTDDELDTSTFRHSDPGYREHCRAARKDVVRIRELHEKIRSGLNESLAKA